jgi:hypothetical protein
MTSNPGGGHIVAMGGGGFSMEPDNPLWTTSSYRFRDAWSRGSVLSGVSAGWFSGGLTDSYGGLERLNDGRGLIEAVACPHYGGNERRVAFHQTIAEGVVTGYAADDGAALHFVGASLAELCGDRCEPARYAERGLADDFRSRTVAGGDVDPFQSSTFRPGTRWNSVVLCVTSVSSRALA